MNIDLAILLDVVQSQTLYTDGTLHGVPCCSLHWESKVFKGETCYEI